MDTKYRCKEGLKRLELVHFQLLPEVVEIRIQSKSSSSERGAGLTSLQLLLRPVIAACNYFGLIFIVQLAVLLFFMDFLGPNLLNYGFLISPV